MRLWQSMKVSWIENNNIARWGMDHYGDDGSVVGKQHHNIARRETDRWGHVWGMMTRRFVVVHS